MPVLTAYAPQPAHSTGWASLNRNTPFPSRFEHMDIKGSSLIRIDKNQKRCKSQLDKMNKSMPPFKKTKTSRKRSAAIDNAKQHVAVCAPVIKGILMKPSSNNNLYQSTTPVAGSEIALVAGSTSVQSSLASTRCKPVIKKVRFSGHSRPQNSVLQGQLSLHSHLASLASNESDRLHDSHLYPVKETIFFTHSRYSYDRSPIAVDKVLNKSLDLPPRSQLDALSGGRWLSKSTSTHFCEEKEAAKQSLGYFDSQNSLSDTSAFSTSSKLRIPRHMETLECPDLDFHPHSSDSDDGPNNSTHRTSANLVKRSSPQTNSVNLKPVGSLVSMTDLEIEGEQRVFTSITPDDNLTFHSFSNLKLEETGEEIEEHILEVDDLFGIGNWTRAQVFGSCDALDGF